MFVFEDVNDSLAAWEDLFSQAIDLHTPIMHKRLTKDILDQLSNRDTLLKKGGLATLLTRGQGIVAHEIRPLT